MMDQPSGFGRRNAARRSEESGTSASSGLFGRADTQPARPLQFPLLRVLAFIPMAIGVVAAGSFVVTSNAIVANRPGTTSAAASSPSSCRAKARELYLLSPVLSAQEALALGMVTKVVPDAEIDAAARELAMSLAQGPTVTLGYIKRNINNAEHMSLEACFDGEAIHHSRAGETSDHKEAAKAFVEKRKPVFRGK